jgi:APA family basic amino acid/polyamine antiporter
VSCRKRPPATACSRPRSRGTAGAGVPAYGIVAGTLLASALTVVSYTSFAKVFATIVLLSVLTAVIPYLFSAAAQVYWLPAEGRRIRSGHLTRDLVVAAVALLFGIWALAGSGYQAAYYGLFCLLLGVPIYIWLKIGRREDGAEGASR